MTLNPILLVINPSNYSVTAKDPKETVPTLCFGALGNSNACNLLIKPEGKKFFQILHDNSRLKRFWEHHLEFGYAYTVDNLSMYLNQTMGPIMRLLSSVNPDYAEFKLDPSLTGTIEANTQYFFYLLKYWEPEYTKVS